MSGLSDLELSQWPKISVADTGRPPIDRLAPGSDLHARVLAYLLQRLTMSELAMGSFYSRWRLAEMRHQAYVNLPDYEKELRTATEKRSPPEITSIVVPYSFATINTIVTYLVNAFLGRKPIFMLGTYKKECLQAVRYQEIMLQHNAEHTRLTRQLYQALMDGQIYGLSAMKILWKNERAMRTRISKSLFGSKRTRELTTVYEGNAVETIDPFMFFPDPRVPMIDVARKGEFVAWRAFTGKHDLLLLQSQGKLAYVDKAGAMPAGARLDSNRMLAATNSTSRETTAQLRNNIAQEDTIVIKLIPRELGLGTSTVPTTWIFTLLNKTVIAQAQPLDYDHGMLPVAVSEPYTNGYGFGHNGMADLLAPIQDALSWFLNTHIYNVKGVLNNMFVVDPSRIELQDFKTPGAGKLLRLKPAAMGTDVRTAITQLNVADVTQNHVSDFAMFMRLGDALSAVNDNLRGMQETASRKTATEVRTSAEAGSSRLASLARLISAQQIVDIAEQQSINLQQFLSQEYSINVLGSDGAEELINIGPDQVIGDFYYPVHDGTLPIDKVAMLDVWKEIMMGVAQDPQLRQAYDITKIFEHVAELGGAKDIEKFRVGIATQDAIDKGQQAGNIVPLTEMAGNGQG